MGSITPNISIYIPANGEEVYGTSFAAGMQNIDQHDHSGGPNKGVPLSSASIGPGSITRDKLAANVLSPGGGLTFDINNAIKTVGVLPALSGLGGNGILVQTGAATAANRSIVGTAFQIAVANGDGVAGNPLLSLISPLNVNGINRLTAGNFTISLNGVLQATFSPGVLDLNGGTIAQIRSYSVLTAVLPAAGGTQDLINLPAGSIWLFTAQSNIIDGNSFCLYIVYVPNVGLPTFLPITTTPPNQNVTFSAGGLTTIAVNNTSGAANRSFNVSGVRIF